MKTTLLDKLDDKIRPDPDQIRFPSPKNFKEIGKRIEEIGGVDVCYGGFGITGHFAFNDPPLPSEEMIVEEMKQLPVRIVTITRESTTQMAMGGTDGNWKILPTKAVTLGWKEILASKKIHLTFMRSWHAGVFRRALFGPITVQCPGSLIQDHPNVEVTVTELAAMTPRFNLSQSKGGR
jgi:glucosamine-6-phosphate deaminase